MFQPSACCSIHSKDKDVNYLPIDGSSSVRNKRKSTPLMPSDQLIAVDGVPGAAGFGAYHTVQLVPIFLGPNRDHKQTATGDISTKCGERQGGGAFRKMSEDRKCIYEVKAYIPNRKRCGQII